MNLYREHVFCDKCASHKVKSHLVKAGERNPEGFFQPKYEFDTINRHCENCGNFWPELPLDSEQAEVSLDYVVGFAFSQPLGYVAMIKKNRPDWQVGLLNGIGGKIEFGESPLAAQIREFHQECSLGVDDNWRQFATLSGNNDGKLWRVVFHWTYFTSEYNSTTDYGLTDEQVKIYPREGIMSNRFRTVSNVPMLLETAMCSIASKQLQYEIKEL